MNTNLSVITEPKGEKSLNLKALELQSSTSYRVANKESFIFDQVLVVASENTRMSFIFYSELKAILFVVVNLQLVLP